MNGNFTLIGDEDLCAFTKECVMTDCEIVMRMQFV